MQRLKSWLETLRSYDVQLLTLGETTITLWGLLKLCVSLFLLFVVARWLRYWIAYRLLPTQLDSSTRYALGALTRYLVIVFGTMAILQTAGINIMAFTLLAGAIGVGVGFGLQDIVRNFISGLIVMFDRPVRIGDRVDIGGVEGDVIDIGARRITLLTPGQVAVIVPNSKLITDNVKNLQRYGGAGMIRLNISVSRESDPREAERLLREFAAEHEDVLKEPPPLVRLLNPTASAMPFELDLWTHRTGRDREQLRNELYYRLNDLVIERGIKLA